MALPVRARPALPTTARHRVVATLAALLLCLGALVATGTPAEAATAVPGGLKASASGTTTLDLTWKAVAGAPRYRVQYSTASSMSGAVYKRVTANKLTLSGLKPGQAYYVKVRVITADGDNLSAYSKAVEATTKKGLAAPSGLATTKRSTTSVALKWGSRGSGIRYRVQWSTSSSMKGASYKRFTATSGTISGLDPSTAYWFKVRVISNAGDNLSPYSGAVKVTTAAMTSTGSSGAKTLRVATFNVKCANCFAGAANEGTWYQRRAAVVATIKAQAPDVIGVQEASQGWLKDGKGKPVSLSQFEDLRNRLGSGWTLTNAKRNNCVKSTTPTGCKAKAQGASQGTRILFNAKKVEMVRSGATLLSSLDSKSNARYLAWAVLRQKSTGKKFFYADAHLDHGDDLYAMRKAQAKDMVKSIKKNNPDRLPVVVVGDWNSSRFEDPDNAPYDVLVAAGYRDPLGQVYDSTRTAPGAFVKKRVNTWMNSFNDFVRAAKGNRAWVNGSYLDYMLMSPGIKVDEWENVARLGGGDDFVGTIPSDHNMQRATIVLP